MPKVISWTYDEWKDKMLCRLDAAKRHRAEFEPQWMENRRTVFYTNDSTRSNYDVSFDIRPEAQAYEAETGDSDIGMNYAFKYWRFFHSQLSANPPSVLARPATSDPLDRRKADAADRLVRHAMRDKDMQEVTDQMANSTLLYGTGWVKQVWDPDAGDAYDFNEETDDILMEGDIRVYSPDTENVWIDPDATRWTEVRYVIERLFLPLEDALFKFPENAEAIRAAAQASKTTFAENRAKATSDEPYVELYEYYEKAAPINGMAGRHCRFLVDGTIIGVPGKNPHYQARLPYKLFTYIDVPGQVYGKSAIEYVARLQQVLDRLDSSILDNIQAHGVARLAIPAASEIMDEAITNSPWDYIKYTGNQPPMPISAPSLMPDIWRFRDQILMAMQELFGVNDAMQGILRRETSAVSQQTAIESGVMIHRRLFKKYAMVIEDIYQDYIGLVRDNWTTPRTVLVMGKEKAFEAADLKGADVAGGFDLVVEYGASLPIDPNMRREAILLLMEPLKEAGMSMKQILKMMKLNDLESMYDRMELAAERQREIFEEMIVRHTEGTPVYIGPDDLQEHQGMLEYAYDYIMTSEFKYLPSEQQELIKRHIREREALMAKKATPPQPTGDVNIPGMPGVAGAAAPMLAMP